MAERIIQELKEVLKEILEKYRRILEVACAREKALNRSDFSEFERLAADFDQYSGEVDRLHERKNFLEEEFVREKGIRAFSIEEVARFEPVEAAELSRLADECRQLLEEIQRINYESIEQIEKLSEEALDRIEHINAGRKLEKAYNNLLSDTASPRFVDRKE